MTESVDSKQGLYVFEDLTDEEIAREAEFYGDLTGSVRDLVELALSTESDDDDIRQAREHLEAAKALLSKRTRPQPYGVRWNAAGNRRAWGNAVVGLRNAVAPPLRIQREPDGRVWADVELGMQYEGPAGLTHGGISALQGRSFGSLTLELLGEREAVDALVAELRTVTEVEEVARRGVGTAGVVCLHDRESRIGG